MIRISYEYHAVPLCFIYSREDFAHLERRGQTAEPPGWKVGAAQHEEQEAPLLRRRHLAQTRQEVTERLHAEKTNKQSSKQTDRPTDKAGKKNMIQNTH